MQFESALFGMVTVPENFVVITTLVLIVAVLVLVAVCAKLLVALRRMTINRDELVAAQQDIEATIKAKGEFLVSMSHEIRNPMNALTSFTEILIQRVSQNCDAKLREDTEGILDIIKGSSHDLLAIISDVLDYIKIDANLLTIESIPTSIKQVIHDVCNTEKPSAIAKHLELLIKYSGDVPATILCDPVRIRQILSNLISNAVKFTDRGSVTVACEVLNSEDSSILTATPPVLAKEGAGHSRHPFSATSLQLKISVIDTGIGISPSHLKELYKPFRHVDSTVLHKKRGAGLGLNIAMRLATLMDGTITIESTLGQGSTFSLLLNVYVPEGEASVLLSKEGGKQPEGSRLHEGLEIRVPKKNLDAAASTDAERPLQNIRVLVVEDMTVNQVIMSVFLREAGAKVEFADNGAIGVQKVLKDMDDGLYFDVILMDMQMPVMDGYEATAYLRSHGYTHPIIAVTAHALTGDREKTLNAGCDDYIAKPVDNKTLIDMVKKHIEKN